MEILYFMCVLTLFSYFMFLIDVCVRMLLPFDGEIKMYILVMFFSVAM